MNPYVLKPPTRSLSTSIVFFAHNIFYPADPFRNNKYCMATFNLTSGSSFVSIEFTRVSMKNKVTTYKNVQLVLTDEQIAQKYSGFLVTINNLASQGKTQYATSLSENDYAIFVPFLRKNGFTVVGNPISKANQLAGVAGSRGDIGSLSAPGVGTIGSNLITISWD